MANPPQSLGATLLEAHEGGQGEMVLVVIADGVAETHPLPRSAVLTIGRAPDCAIRVEHASMSRTHARLAIVEGALTIEDLGSSNGTRVRDAAIEANDPVPVAPGDIIEVGSVSLMLQRQSQSPSHRRVWSHGYFEERLEKACEIARRTGGSVALLRIHATAVPPVGAIARALTEVAPKAAVLGAYGPGELEVFIPRLDRAGAEELARELTAEARRHGAEVRVAAACFPESASNPYTLLAIANRDVLDAAPARPGAPIVVAPAMKTLHRMIEKIAAGSISVLVLGETGVGKEIVAQAVHRASPRASGPFVALNCSALPANLLESELFGHEKGAFTGATHTRPGLLESASGGTVFLDEVGEMPLDVQVKLLRVLEERALMRVGGREPIAIDVRLVAATNRDLEAEVRAGNFRQDLLYRLDGVTLAVPPLRDRVVEIEPLAAAFAAAAAADVGLPAAPGLSSEALDALRAYSWPGNIRELRNVVERAVLLCDERIELADLPIDKMQASQEGQRQPSARPEPVASPEPAAASGEPVSEKQRIVDALAACFGNQTRAAEILGVSRRTLTNKLNKYNIPRPIKGNRR